VGDLKFNRKVWFRGTELRAEEVAAQIAGGDRKKVTVGERTPWYFTKKIWLPDYTHAVRIGFSGSIGMAKRRSRF
jgi:hypothetical protein